MTNEVVWDMDKLPRSMQMTFEEWWEKRPQGVMSDKQFARVVYEAGYEAGYNDCRDHWGGLTYCDPCNDFTNGLKR